MAGRTRRQFRAASAGGPVVSSPSLLGQRRGSALAAAVVLAVGLGACGSKGPDRLTTAELKDPSTCQTCHPAHFEQWSHSMHAYASDDPVFVAMNKRGQRETNGTLGDFCVKCHAPLALRDGLTTDGQNLATLAPAERGVTCFFCHSVEAITGDHNDPLTLATDGRMLGPIGDPVSAPHLSGYAPHFDGPQLESASACGSCHDIVNQHDVALERTFKEWQGTLFAVAPHGKTCAQCHMGPTTQGPAATTSTTSRTLHPHEFPAIDVPLSPFPGSDPELQRKQAQAMLDTTIQVTVCVDDVSRNFTVALDNVGAGHSWPSGASQDRRAWVEVSAFAGAETIYHSGVAAGETPEAAADPDLWVLRDCIFDDARAEAHMFWQATSLTANAIPGPVMSVLTDPTSFVRSHQKRIYPVSAQLTQAADKITVQISLTAIGSDVLKSLVDSQDLDPAIAAAVPTYQLGGGASFTWTRTDPNLQMKRDKAGNQLLCLYLSKYTPVETVPAADTHARCIAPPAI